MQWLVALNDVEGNGRLDRPTSTVSREVGRNGGLR